MRKLIGILRWILEFVVTFICAMFVIGLVGSLVYDMTHNGGMALFDCIPSEWDSCDGTTP